MPYTHVVALVSLQVHDEDEHGFGTYTVIHKTAPFAEKLGLQLQFVSGDPEDVEVDGVEQAFVGISLTAMPDDLRMAFFIGQQQHRGVQP